MGPCKRKSPTSLSQSAGQIAAADLNGDGKADLAGVYFNCSDTQINCSPGQAVVLIGNGDGTFQPEVVYAAGLEPEYLTIGDFNGDAKPDLAVSNMLSNTVSILLNNGNGTFQTHQDYPTGLYPASIITGDFNGDGKPDLITQTEAGFSLLLGNGDGTFRTHTDTAVGNQLTSLTAGDFNGDGKLDLAVGTTSERQVFILLGKGDGTFQMPVSYASGISGYPSVADFNGDGKADLIIGAESPGTSAVLLGNGDGTFGPPTFTFLGTGVVAVPDLNHDGVPDIVGPSGYDTKTSAISVTLSTAFKAIAPAALNFGSQGLGTTSTPQTITLSNPSHVSLNIAHIAASGNFSQTNDCGASLAPGKNCAITVSFSPAATGSEPGVITISDSSKITPLLIPLTGSGVNGAALTVHPGRLSFSTQAVGTSSKPASVVLVNTGNSGLNIAGISIAGADTSDFTQSNNCGVALAAAASCTVNVAFSPTGGGSRVASLAISGTEPGSPQNIVLSGAGWRLRISPWGRFPPSDPKQ